ncbi:hypothetical protein MPSEU_000661000 [Mayamaea pseudoterrestris]|nr:hypothetical protein MPSEU_000661000 [Mayamaea pseudoterrestris]
MVSLFNSLRRSPVDSSHDSLLGDSQRNNQPNDISDDIGPSINHQNYASVDNGHQLDESHSSNWSDIRSPSFDSQATESSVVGQPIHMPLKNMVCILSTAFSYGCIMTTLFIITLPTECERIHQSHPTTPKSVALGIFVSAAGLTQLISPLAGRLSDNYKPPNGLELGQRLPYLVLGSFSAVIGLMGQMFASSAGNVWFRYGICFLLNMLGLTLMYSMMLALIPDQVPAHQTGVANGVLALLLTTGSLFGFGLMHLYYDYYSDSYSLTVSKSSKHKTLDLSSVYALYICVVIVSTILTGTYGHDRDAELAAERMDSRRSEKQLEEDDDEAPSDKLVDTTIATASNTTDPSLAHHVHHHKHGKRRSQWRHAVGRTTRKATQAVIVTPSIILKSMLIDPFQSMHWREIRQSYTIDRVKYHDFYFVTLSRLFYYCGMSVQTFFLYFLKDIIHKMHHQGPETAVASLAILGQCAAALTCYPVGVLSDKVLGGKRKPFVYLSCAVLCAATAAIIWARTLSDMMHLCLIIGAANGVYLTMDTSLAVDTLPKAFELEHDDSIGSAQLLGVWGVAALLGTTLGPMDDGCAATTDTYDESYTIYGYAVVLGLSSFYYLLSAWSLCYVRSHHE